MGGDGEGVKKEESSQCWDVGGKRECHMERGSRMGAGTPTGAGD